MKPLVFTHIGVGNMAVAPAVVATLGTYFGERPLEVRLFDADEERADLMQRFAEMVFQIEKTGHQLVLCGHLGEAMEGAERVVLSPEANFSRRLARLSDPAQAWDVALSSVARAVPKGVACLSLLGPEIRVPLRDYYRIEWPPPIGPDQLRAMPHQILRWLRTDEYVQPFLRQHAGSPLKRWIDDPSSADLVLGSPL
ncbi:MAG: hypothetical protein KIS66_08615 [Fimbriimonadaceae bacterium]|nr:hypothetical protein [Fimbriimonadaceae bacterium]